MKESIDIVFVANSKNSTLWLMTRNAIRTAKENPGMKIGKIVVAEQCLTARPQPGTKMLYYDWEFNYNKCLNLGFSVCKSKYIAFCNNDLHFSRNWAINAINVIKQGYLSVSPTSKHTFAGIKEGYTVGDSKKKPGQIMGWCIIVDRIVIDKIGGFDCPVNFWFSDNVYAVQLRIAGIKHALVGNSKVRHFTSSTLRKMKEGKKRANMQRGQEKIFNQYKKQKYANTSIKE